MAEVSEEAAPDFSPSELAGLSIARADLGYVSAAMLSGVVERTLAFLPHAVLVAFEAYDFCGKQLSIAMPDLAWDTKLAAASRASAKYFDDNRRDIEALAGAVDDLVVANNERFRGGWKRRLARAMHIPNPDLGVMSLGPIPLSTTISMSFHAGATSLEPGKMEVTNQVALETGEGIGQMAAILGISPGVHQPAVTSPEAVWSWGDGELTEVYGQAFAGEAPTRYVPLLVLLQGAAASAALLAQSECCGECRFAAFKHRLVVVHHLARSMFKMRATAELNSRSAPRIDRISENPVVQEVLNMRSLRNGLVHYGLSDVPAEVFAAEFPVLAVCEHYAEGRTFSQIDELVRTALEHVYIELTSWLLEPPPGGPGFMELLRPPAGGMGTQ